MGTKFEGADPLKKRDWRPDQPCGYAPLFYVSRWSKELFTWFFGYPGYLWPWNVIYLTLCLVSHQYTTPAIEECGTFKLGWIATVFTRNLVLLWLVSGGWHLALYQLKTEGTKKKYDHKWQATNNPRFLFNDQVYDNVFWSCTSGVGFWTAYEVIMLNWWSTNPQASAVYFDFWSRPVYSIAWLLAIPIWREFHFYWVHRFSHVKIVYKTVHYLHHKNSNPGPWSGLAMHPVEHLLYFSVVLIHFLVPSHPIHFFFNAQHTALTPSGGHHGFEGPILEGSVPAGGLPTGSYFHYLHHRYFECNYGEATIPLDKLFGTFRDGAPDGLGNKLKEEHR
eukprot:gene19175-10493_t